MPDIDYRLLPAIKLPLANKFYREVNARGKASGGDVVSVARDISTGAIVAVARLAPIKDDKLLTGVYVAAPYRQRGIASLLIKHLVHQHPSCYTFALTHLTDFYLRLGFTLVADDDLPCELAQRFKAYRQQGRNILAMIKK
jgi:N-acetylglutamate synthase-like GNAT family acetyltransferase